MLNGSVYGTFSKRQSRRMQNRGYGCGKGMIIKGNLFKVMEMFCILFVVTKSTHRLTELYTKIKIINFTIL